MIKTILTNPAGQTVSGTVFLKDIRTAQTKAGKPYGELDLVEGQRSISAKWWDLPKTLPDKGILVDVTGKIDEYNGTRQLIIQSLKENTQAHLEDYLPSAPVSQSDLKHGFNSLFTTIKEVHPDYAQLILHIMEESDTNLFSQPATHRGHHAYLGGLAYHTLTLTRAITALVPIYPDLDQGLLLTAALIHDFGKRVTLSSDSDHTPTPVQTLVGNSALVDGWITRAAYHCDLDPAQDEDVLLLRHVLQCLNQGHITPAVPEAAVLVHLDQLDHTLDTFKTAYLDTEPGTCSNPIWDLNNKPVYKPSYQLDEEGL